MVEEQRQIFLIQWVHRFLKKVQKKEFGGGLLYDRIATYCEDLFDDEFVRFLQEQIKQHEKEAEKNWISFSNFFDQEAREKAFAIFESAHKEELNEDVRHKNLDFFADILDLNEDERKFLYFTFFYNSFPWEERKIIDTCVTASEDSTEFYSFGLNMEKDAVRDLFSDHSVFLGLVHTDSRGISSLSNTITNLVSSNYALTKEHLITTLFPNKLDTELSLSDYEHFDEDIEVMQNMLTNAMDSKASGINVLLWGVPGTGKTELPLVMAKEAGWNMYIIGDISHSNDTEKSREERLVNLKLAQKIFKDKKVILLFDEIEDLFKLDLNAEFSKAFLNRVIEKTPVPIIWTTNELLLLGTPTVRRMTYAIEFDVPNAKVRRRLWEKFAAQWDLTLDEDTLVDISLRYDIVPAVINSVCKTVSLSQLPIEHLKKVLDNLDTAVRGGDKRKEDDYHIKTVFNTSISNSSINLDSMVDNIIEKDISYFSVCAYGPPGTGKSAFGRYLAGRMGKHVLFKRASDLESMWVGQAEKNIAHMFKKARDEERFLILDEADYFLASRKNAVRSWEISRTNEFLTQMETHNQPFFATTNLKENLDEATLRRFTFKIKFDYLKQEQINAAFKFFFGMDTPYDMSSLDVLTSGDFANVKHKCDILSITNPKEIYDLIREETEAKPDYKHPIGFRPTLLVDKTNDNAEPIAAKKKDIDET